MNTISSRGLRLLMAWPALFGRYGRVTRAAWRERKRLQPAQRSSLEREFLPAALELMETPAPALARAVLLTIVLAACLALIWVYTGRVDMVAVAQGKVIAADKAKVIQAAETGVVKSLRVRDGQFVKAGDVLVELEAAATATGAETQRIHEAHLAAVLESARHDALAAAASGRSVQVAFTMPAVDAPVELRSRMAESERRLMQSQYLEHRARISGLDAEMQRKEAELRSAGELVSKLAATLPLAQKRANDYRDLLKQNFVSQHGWMEREQVRIEQERDLGYQRSRVQELTAAISETRTRKASLIAEFERIAINSKTEADKRAAQLQQELVKADTRQKQQQLTAPVDGTVQQLAINTVGGVVQAAQALMVIAPADYQAEVEAMLENKDVGFVKVGQKAEIKVETFPFTRYGTLSGTVSVLSQDAIVDEKRGLIFQARVRLDQRSLKVDGREIAMSPGMAVSAEIATGQRRVIDYFLDTVRKTVGEGLRER